MGLERRRGSKDVWNGRSYLVRIGTWRALEGINFLWIENDCIRVAVVCICCCAKGSLFAWVDWLLPLDLS